MITIANTMIAFLNTFCTVDTAGKRSAGNPAMASAALFRHHHFHQRPTASPTEISTCGGSGFRTSTGFGVIGFNSTFGMSLGFVTSNGFGVLLDFANEFHPLFENI